MAPRPAILDQPPSGERRSRRVIRVARIITRLNVGGPSIQAIDLSRELSGCGFETCLIHGALGHAEGDMASMMPIAAAQTVHVPTLKRQIALVDDVRAWWRLYRLLRRWQPDIVHTHMAKAGALGRLAAIAHRFTSTGRAVRLVHTYHGHVFEGYFDPKKTRLFLAVERWLARRTDALVAISPAVRRDILETYQIGSESQVRLIALGFNLDRLASITPADRVRARADLGIAAGSVVVTTVGRLTAIKQHSLFLEAAARVVSQSTGSEFLIVGDGELRDELEAQAVRFGLGAKVRFLGWRQDLERIYGATDLFVLTSRNEGTPVALIEALAAGVASISTDVGGVRDVITDSSVGQLVPFGEPRALADAMAALIANPDRRASLGAAGRAAVVGRFHLSRLVQEMSGLYRELLQK